MVNNIDGAVQPLPKVGALIKREPLMPRELKVPPRHDLVELGLGNPLSRSDQQNIVLERAFEKLRGVVDAARAELGIPEGGKLDTSEEATANRIADFALGFFSKYAENNGLADDEAGRAQFAEFIGAAIGQGIDEARGILTALNALNTENAFDIGKTQGVIQSRLDDFVANGA